ncbi:transposase [Salinimonas marina]|uniref:Transposase n=1 Tax=Salinimonas marina TaxID=2785918 RepID=A0A7S9HBV2_9ALTE|nr:transposase [Salinimonas marina]QPG04611.1 transposase [Salinimonas marina]
MPRPRSSLISLTDTPYYHCVSRCVRRAFLCGHDRHSGQSYEHRRQWIEDRLYNLANVFAIHLCAYAVMSNHTHVVLKADKSLAESWSAKEVLKRWHRLYQGTLLTRMYCDPAQSATLSAAQRYTVEQSVEVYRKRLYDISWYMRALNEYIARQANKEDRCTGRFWEGRFKSQAILDEAALAACLAYVDLNPIRACMATTPETSAHTSIKKRIKCAKVGKQPDRLYPFAGNPSEHQPDGLPFQFEEYLQLVDSVGRVKPPNKRGVVAKDMAPLLERTGLNTVCWDAFICNIETRFASRVSLALCQKREKHSTRCGTP